MTVRVVDPLWIELSDGTQLCARAWLPADAEENPVPAILEYLPYRKDDVTAPDDALHHPYFAGHGYAAIRVDIRGSGDSGGILTDEYSRQEQDDALEVIAWIAAQPWCSGAVGMMGISWGGFNSLQVAARRPPELKAIITACSTDDRYDNDVHYLGGCPLGYYLAPWSSVMLSFNARPPDPAIVGDRWREIWQERLDGNVDLIATWLGHQRRDDYWRQGSICEDYDAITCPVFAVGGWADAYVDAIFRMLERLSCPRRALVGPWGHQWPELGRPGPAIGFLQEAVRWFDHWLKGTDTGVMDEPMLRAWMQDAVPPRTDYEERPGRWVAEPAWPPPNPQTLDLVLGASGLAPAPQGDERLAHSSSLTVGIDAGAWCAYGNPADLPADQRRDDALSLTFDTAPLDDAVELLGQPELALLFTADKPRAFVVARLCDVAPDGASTLITRGVLNLCHRGEDHEQARDLAPGDEYAVRVPLKSVAYLVPVGHRLRLALSTSYWPWLWPSPERATLTVITGGGSSLSLPVRAARPEDQQLAPLGPPETAPPLAFEWLRRRAPRQEVLRDDASGAVEMRMARDFFGAKRLPNGLEYHDHDPVRLSIVDDDPLSAKVECGRTIELKRGDWRTRIEVRSVMTADADDFHVSSVVDAYEGDTRIHTRGFTTQAPRDHC